MSVCPTACPFVRLRGTTRLYWTDFRTILSGEGDY